MLERSRKEGIMKGRELRGREGKVWMGHCVYVEEAAMEMQ